MVKGPVKGFPFLPPADTQLQLGAGLSLAAPLFYGKSKTDGPVLA